MVGGNGTNGCIVGRHFSRVLNHEVSFTFSCRLQRRLGQRQREKERRKRLNEFTLQRERERERRKWEEGKW